MTKQPAVYILANKRNGTLYVGVTSDLVKRIWEHKQDAVAGFTRKYQVHDLVYFEQHEDMNQAIQREKQIKKWNRAWKTELIEKHNLAWRDLCQTLPDIMESLVFVTTAAIQLPTNPRFYGKAKTTLRTTSRCRLYCIGGSTRPPLPGQLAELRDGRNVGNPDRLNRRRV